MGIHLRTCIGIVCALAIFCAVKGSASKSKRRTSTASRLPERKKTKHHYAPQAKVVEDQCEVLISFNVQTERIRRNFYSRKNEMEAPQEATPPAPPQLRLQIRRSESIKDVHAKLVRKHSTTLEDYEIKDPNVATADYEKSAIISLHQLSSPEDVFDDLCDGFAQLKFSVVSKVVNVTIKVPFLDVKDPNEPKDVPKYVKTCTVQLTQRTTAKQWLEECARKTPKNDDDTDCDYVYDFCWWSREKVYAGSFDGGDLSEWVATKVGDQNMEKLALDLRKERLDPLVVCARDRVVTKKVKIVVNYNIFDKKKTTHCEVELQKKKVYSFRSFKQLCIDALKKRTDLDVDVSNLKSNPTNGFELYRGDQFVTSEYQDTEPSFLFNQVVQGLRPQLNMHLAVMAKVDGLRYEKSMLVSVLPETTVLDIRREVRDDCYEVFLAREVGFYEKTNETTPKFVFYNGNDHPFNAFVRHPQSFLKLKHRSDMRH